LFKWFKLDKPEVYSNIKHIFPVKDYVRFKLTNEAYTEVTDFSGTALLNIHDVKHDKKLSQEYGLE